MTEQTPCPNPARWKELLEGSLPENEQTALNAHLEVCPSCQQTLEGLAAGSETWSGAARHLVAGGHGNEAALQRVMAELEAETDPPTTQTNPHPGAEVTLDFLSPSEKPDQLGRLGHYAVTEVIGRGGMGIVLKAVDEKLHRVVAIKVMAPQLATNADARKRFRREAQAAAAVRNEHVIDIHAVEEANGLPYLVMEYVSGLSLQERLDQTGSLDLKRILRIGMQTAAGLAAAHVQGLIHRDIKPANILLENSVERVKITDFGLARAVDDASLTQSGVVAGTPQYMAPEQARGEAVDHRADLFSLGSVLYAMCTGRAPFRADGTMAILKRVCEDTPRPLREINPDMPDWLCAIITRLHAKDPAERFPSAAEVAELLGQHLAHLQEPALVPVSDRLAPAPRPASGQGPRRRRWVAAALLLLLGGSLGLSEATGVTRVAATVLRIVMPDGTLLVEVDDPQVKVTIEGDGGLVITGAGPQEVHLRPGSYRLLAAKDGRPLKDEIIRITRGDTRVVTVRLEAAGGAPAPAPFRFAPPPPGPLDRLDPARIPARERFDWQPKELVGVLGEHRARQWGSTCVALSPDGKRGASCGSDRAIYVWDAETLHLRTLLVGHTRANWSVAFSPDGRRLLSGGDDQTMRLWDLDTGRELRCFRGHAGAVWSVAYSPDGRRALSGGDDRIVRMWDLETGQELAQWKGHTGLIGSVAFSPDGSQALSGSVDKTMRLWDVETGKERRCFRGHTENFRVVVFLPDGRQALSCSHDKTLRLWDLQTGEEVRRFQGHVDQVFSVAVSADGRRALSGGLDGTVRLWDVETGRQVRSLACRRPVSSVAFYPDGRRAVSFGWDGVVRLWDLESGKELSPPVRLRKWERLLRLAFSPDGRRLVAAVDDTIRMWDVASGRELRRFELPDVIWGVAFSADGRYVLGAGVSDMALWDADDGRELRRFAGSHFWDAALSRDGRRALTGGADGTVRLWDVESGRELNSFLGHRDNVMSVALAPDGRGAVTGSLAGEVRLWDLEAGRQRHVLRERGVIVWSVAFAPDGRHVAAGDGEGFVRLWDVSGAEPKWRPLPKWHTGAVPAVAFAPDARALASVGQDGRIIVCEVPTGAKRQEWQLPVGIDGVAFAPDGRHLAAANGNGTVYILRLPKP